MNGELPAILLVEDNPDHAELVLRTLEDGSARRRINWVTDGELALDYLYVRGAYSDQARCPRPNLVLLDLRLPRLDGLEVLKWIKADAGLQTIPVVVLTTSTEECDMAVASALHAERYLTKPVDGSVMSEMLCELGL